MRIFVFSRSVTATLLILGVVASLTLLPVFFGTQAVSRSIESGDPGRIDYDIRKDKSAFPKIVGFRQAASKSAVEVADIRDNFAIGEAKLRKTVPKLKVEYNDDLRVPEVIGSDVKQGGGYLTAGQPGNRVGVLKDFLSNNRELIGVESGQISELRVAADYQNPEGDLSFAELNQVINSIPVFRGEVKAGFSKDGRMFRVINNLASGIDPSTVSTEFGSAGNAVLAAAETIGHKISSRNLKPNEIASTDLVVRFGTDDWATTAEKMYFPTEPGVVVPAWRVLIWERVDAFYVVVDATNGTMLWRKNITDDQTSSATYNVYANPNAMINVADSPFPMTPGTSTPSGAQAAGISRTSVTRIGNESPYTFNNNGWITDGINITDGNAVESGLDRDGTNGVDVSNGVVTGSPNRVFDFPINPGIPTNPALGQGDSPVPAGEVITPCSSIVQPHAQNDYQRAIITQLFYISNWYHDEMYRLGFTEQARNFQNDNFGRGGSDGDRVSAEAQDCGGTNNANFGTPADGGRGRMQMFLWTNPTPDYDGSLDADIVIHELTHGLSNRLHGNSSGLGGLNMSRAMGEGWSDFYAHAMLSEPSDPLDGVYTTGGYATYQLRGGLNAFNNYYYGIRRFPKAIMSSVGPNAQPHNPLTFEDIDPTKFNVGNGAFGPGTVASSSDGVHAGGEIWSSALWEIRAKYINRLGWETGNRRILQHVTDGMKLAPLLPTFISERDAIIAGVLEGGTAADVEDMWAGFAIRGLGASASIQNSGGTDTFGAGTGLTRVTEAFDLPNLELSGFSVSDTITGNGNGVAEPGELVRISYSVANRTGRSADVTSIVYSTVNENLGTVSHSVTLNLDDDVVIPGNTACGALLTFNVQLASSLGTVDFPRSIPIGQPVETFAQNFDTASAPAFPAGWTVASTYAPMTFVTTSANPDSAPLSAFAADLPNCTGSGCPTTDGGATDLTSPSIPIASQTATVSFRHRFNTESGWDGGVFELSFNGGAYQDILIAGGSFMTNGYNSTMGVSAPNPLGGRQGWSGDSGGYQTTVVRLPSGAAGQNVNLRWRFGADNNTAPAGGGWNVDSVSVSGSSACAAIAVDVGGRVVDQLGRGIAKTSISMAGGSTVRRTQTNSFGYFAFTNVAGGVTYTLSASSKRYTFTPQQVTPTSNVNGLVFSAN